MLEAIPRLSPEQTARGDLHILELQFDHRHTTNPHLVLDLANIEAIKAFVPINQECAHPSRP